MFENRSLIKPIERAIDNTVLGVSVAQHHGQALVSRKLLDGPYISARCRHAADG